MSFYNCLRDPQCQAIIKAWALYIVSLIAGEATLLYGIGVKTIADFNLGILLQMIITWGSITLPWLTDKNGGNTDGTK